MLALDGKKHKDLIIMIMALGDAYLEKGLYKDAAKRYHQLLDFKVTNRKIFTNLSKAYIGLKRVDKFAQYVYQKAIQYDPSNTEIYDILTTTFLNEGRKDPRAIEIYELALKYNPPNFDKLVEHLGAIYFKQNEYIKCKEITEHLLNKSGFQSQAFTLFLKSCWNTDNYNDAIKQLKKLIDTTENNTMLLKCLCVTYLEKKFKADIQNQTLKFSYIDRQLVADYLTKNTHFEKLQDLSFYVELRRFWLEKECWGFFEPAAIANKESIYVYQEQESAAESPEIRQRPLPISINMQHEILEKLSSFQSLTSHRVESHSSVTYDDFKKEGAAIFSDPDSETNSIKMPENAEILLTIALSDFEQMRLNYGMEHIQQVRNKLHVFLTDLLEKFQTCYICGTSNGLIIFMNDVIAAAAIAVEILNKLNRYNFINDLKDELHLTIGIHHSRHDLKENSEQALKDFSMGLKVGIVSDKDLSTEDHAIYGKIFQRSDRIFLSGIAYREIKSANRFKVNTIGQFKLKYLKEQLTLHEIAWRNPIDDLKFGFIKKLGHFDLLAEIGSKDAIKVFKAKDSILQRFVILKVIQSEVFNSLPVNNPKKMEFYQIIKSLGQMSHPNIANIYEVDEDQRLTYIAREFVEGDSIAKIFNNGKPFSPDRFIKIIYQICKALQYSHRIGFFHLNLKPENIRVSANDEIKIMDFLMPKTLLSDYNDLKENLAQIYYMSPEQIHGNPGDGRSDIFSLGVILYQVVTQVHPFASRNVEDMINAILNKIPPPPSELNHQVPKFCEAFILKCMAKNPDKRFQSVEQMVTLLKKTFENSLFSNFNYQIAQSRDSY